MVLFCLVLSVDAIIQKSVMLGVFFNLLVPVLILLAGLMVHMSDVRIVWCSLSVTSLMVSSIISPWFVSSSELDWTGIGILGHGWWEAVDCRC